MKIEKMILKNFAAVETAMDTTELTIDFSNSGTGYTVSGNVVTISSAGSYDLSGTVTEKKI